MNIKRAFIAAIAVLAMPGLAMAQSTNTFNTTINWTGGVGEVETTLTCNSGFPTPQTQMTPFTYAVDSVSAGAECSIMVTGGLPSGAVIDGYVADGGAADPAGCKFAIDNMTLAHTCVINASVTASDFNVVVAWGTSDPDVDMNTIGQNAEAIVRCENVFTQGGLVTITERHPATPQSVYPITVNALPNPIMPYTVCDATIDPTTIESSVEVDASACGSVTLTAGTPGACVITATVFFEGIPTLSQYGMAIMALLMLGVGFVGFRRFV